MSCKDSSDGTDVLAVSEHGALERRPNIHAHFVGRQREDVNQLPTTFDRSARQPVEPVNISMTVATYRGAPESIAERMSTIEFMANEVAQRLERAKDAPPRREIKIVVGDEGAVQQRPEYRRAETKFDVFEA